MKLALILSLFMFSQALMAQDVSFGETDFTKVKRTLAEDRSYIGSELKDVKFKGEDTKDKEKFKKAKTNPSNNEEVLKEETPSKWGISGLYHFYGLSAFDQPNSFSSEVISDFSPGFEIFYQYDFSKDLSLGLRGEYQRVIFQQADNNELNQNATNAFLGGAYLYKNLFSFLGLKLEAGYESSLYLKSVSTGVADVRTIERPYAMVLVNPKLTQTGGTNGLSLGLELGYKQNFEANKYSDTIEVSGTSVMGIKIEKTIDSNHYALGLQYLKSDFKVNTTEQSFDAIRLQLQFSFGGL